MNKRGMTELVLLAILIGGALIITQAPKLSLFGSSAPTTPAKKEASQTYRYKKTPHFVTTEAGKVVKAYEVEEERTTEKSKEGKSVKDLTFAQRLAQNLANLSTLVIIVGIVLAVTAPTLLFSFLARTKARWKNAFMETFRGIEKSGVIDKAPELQIALKDKQQETTKKIVDDLQRSS